MNHPSLVTLERDSAPYAPRALVTNVLLLGACFAYFVPESHVFGFAARLPAPLQQLSARASFDDLTRVVADASARVLPSFTTVEVQPFKLARPRSTQPRR